jgi:SIR2-like domain
MALERETIDRLVGGDENAAAIAAARDTIRDGCVLFAGAGTSKPAGYPLWRELIEEMTALLREQRVDISTVTSTDLLIAANQIYDCFSANGLLPQYHAFLCNRFEPRAEQTLELQKQLLTIPFNGIVTPNFDECFERAIHQMRPMRENVSPRLQVDNNHARHVRQFFDSLHRRDKILSVAHIHGVHDEPTHILLTANQYATAYGLSQPELQAAVVVEPGGTWTLLRKTLWALLATQRLLFVGFGMTDPFIYALMQFVGGDLWDLTTPTHYFVSGVSIEASADPTLASHNLRNRLGVQIIFYEVTGDDHSGLNDILCKLGASQATAGPSTSTISALLGPPA